MIINSKQREGFTFGAMALQFFKQSLKQSDFASVACGRVVRVKPVEIMDVIRSDRRVFPSLLGVSGVLRGGVVDSSNADA